MTVVCGTALAADSKDNQYIGSEFCKTCHEGIWKAFSTNPHFKSLASGKEQLGRTGCESCHGPGGNHFDNGGGKDTIVAFSLLSAGGVQDACLRCHSQKLSGANIQSSQHTLSGVACTSCHSIHGSRTTRGLLKKTQVTLCYGCHADVRAQFA